MREGRAPVWVFIYETAGHRTELTLGSVHELGITQAREMAREYREARAAGIDPMLIRAERRRAVVAARTAAQETRAVEGITLAHAARTYHAGIEHQFKNPKEARRWIAALEQHVPPRVWLSPIAAVEGSALLEFLEPLYREHRETGKDCRQRLETILSWAVIKKYCKSNPAAEVRLHLKRIKPRVRPGNFRSLPWPEAPEFYAKLREREGVAARALELAMLSASRTAEVIGMEWSEYRPDTRTWVIPEARMKSERDIDDSDPPQDHTVFLSDRATQIIEAQRGLHDRLVFPTPQQGKRASAGLSNGAMLGVLKALDYGSRTTVHGLRSTFRSWATERGYDEGIAEAALAHRERDAVRRAYDRVRAQPVDDPMALFTRARRQIMIDWLDFVAGVNRDNVTRLEAKRKARR